MTQVATPATSAASFDTVTVSSVRGRPIQLERSGDELWATFDDPDAPLENGGRVRSRRRVVMTTGSHHQEIYWYETGRARLLGQLPAEYLVDERTWVPRSTVLLHPSIQPFSETGSWNSTCVSCHTTLGKTRLGAPPGSIRDAAQVADSTAVEFGIACEACHGPGEAHVDANRNPWRRYQLHVSGTADDTTLRPDRLAPARRSDVCGQCHSVWEFYDQRGERQANIAGLPYRPGDRLTDSRLIVQPTHANKSPAAARLIAADPQFIRDTFWPDGMVRVSGREYNGLIESPCFTGAADTGRRLSCFSCHVMHKPAGDLRTIEAWADGQLAPAMDGNAACLGCHPAYASDLTRHTRHAPTSQGSLCYNCHMPYTTYGLLKTLRSHQVSAPSVVSTIQTGRPNACNLCHLDRTLPWAADWLQTWYGQPKPPLDGDDARIAGGVLWLLRGDAGQRAIAAQAMAWPPAQRASGSWWMAPFLAGLADDPYEAVRHIALRTLRQLGPGNGTPLDAGSSMPSAVEDRVVSAWNARATIDHGQPRSELLAKPDGELDLAALRRLVAMRDGRPMFLRE
jgi:hypothetical protein